MAEDFEILWSKSAVTDLDEILDYLAAEAGVDKALETYESLRRRISSLADFPERCRRVPELSTLGITEVRESILPPYRIFFRLQDQRATLLGILDSRRNLEELILQRALRR